MTNLITNEYWSLCVFLYITYACTQYMKKIIIKQKLIKKIKQGGDQFMFTFPFQYTTYMAAIFTYFYQIISIPQF